MNRELPMQPDEEKDIVELLRNAGFGVVEGADAVRAKIKEIGEYDRLLCPPSTPSVT